MSGLDGLGWPNPEDEPKPKKTMKSQLEIKLAPTPETDDATLIALDIECGGKFEAVHVQVSKRLERERDRYQESADALVDRLGATQERMFNAERERDRLLKHLNVLTYWRDISECDCHNPLPNGGCLRCDLDKVLNSTNNQND